MKVLCTNASGTGLVQGKVYEVKAVDAYSYTIGDKGFFFSKERFEVVLDTFPSKTTTETLQPWKERRPTSNSSVSSFSGFQFKYGAHGREFRLLIEELVARAPTFEGDQELSREIGIALADLEAALKYGR